MGTCLCPVEKGCTEVSNWNLKPDVCLQVWCKYTQVKKTHCWNKSPGHVVESPSDEAFKSKTDILTKRLSWLQQSYSIAADVIRRDFSGFKARFETQWSVWSFWPFWQAVLGNADQTLLQLKPKRVRKSQFPVQFTQPWLLEDSLTAWCCWGFWKEHRELWSIWFNILLTSLRHWVQTSN